MRSRANSRQELIDCIWVKLNDLNKCRDAASAEGFAGYSLFQNLIVGGQNAEGLDVTNDLSFMCISASMHVMLPQPSLSIRVWNGSPHDLLIHAATLTRTGVGLPAYYNDEVVIPSLMSRGLTLQDAREYNIIGCVEPQKAGKTEGWHDAAFFNMCRPLELVFSDGMENGELVGIHTGDVAQMTTFEEFYDAYKKQMNYAISLLVNADNAIDVAHAERCPLPFLSGMIEDCIGRGKTVQEGGAIYNFTGPQGFGIANMADSLYVIKKLVFEEKKLTLAQFREALAENYGKGLPASKTAQVVAETVKELRAAGKQVSPEEIAAAVAQLTKPTDKYDKLLEMIEEVPKFGNDIEEVDAFARDVAYTYTRPLETFKNPRGGMFQAGLYPVSANVPLGAQTGATPRRQARGKTRGGRRFSLCGKGRARSDRGGEFRFQARPLYRVQRHAVQSEVPSVRFERTRGTGKFRGTHSLLFRSERQPYAVQRRFARNLCWTRRSIPKNTSTSSCVSRDTAPSLPRCRAVCRTTSSTVPNRDCKSWLKNTWTRRDGSSTYRDFPFTTERGYAPSYF